MNSHIYTRQDSLLAIAGVSVAYNGVPVLKDLNATIYNVRRPGMNQGQLVGLLGPSGIGKTTLFRVLAGLIKPDSGEVLIGVNGKSVGPGDVGVVAQNYPLLAHRTVKDNLIFAGTQAKMTTKDARDIAKDYLEEFRLNDHAEKYPIQLSGGQRQRVAIAQQLICNKHFILMDEPFSGLDVVALEKVQEMLIAVANHHEDNTFILVTHDVNAAVAICDAIWLMGRDRDAEGNIIPGARIKESYDLASRDVCWYNNVLERPPAIQLIKEIKSKFPTL